MFEQSRIQDIRRKMSVWLQGRLKVCLKWWLILCLDLWRGNCLDTYVQSIVDQYLFSINQSQPASLLPLSAAQRTWNETLFDVALWANDWWLPWAREDLVGKENLNMPMVLNDLLYLQFPQWGGLMCLSPVSLPLDWLNLWSTKQINVLF